jgi:4-amino-4-deoxy-L-arabinose transferase-like glycosyltransferase
MRITLSHQQSRSAQSPQTVKSCAWKALAVGCAALAVYASSIQAKPFEDEYAYITQSYYADHFFNNEVNHPAWLDLFAYDLQPLPKYLIGLSLHCANLPMPGPQEARNWYKNYAHFGTAATLTAARWPSLILGSLGCMALFGCGTLVKDSRLGAIAAILFMVNPLYSLHAHRAMSDVPCEAFVITALWLALWSWKWAWSDHSPITCIAISILSGIAAGLALQCKFNAFLALMIVAAWTLIGLIAPGIGGKRKIVIASGSIVMLVAALAVFLTLNPYLTARPRSVVSSQARQILNKSPLQRFLFQVRHRMELSDDQQRTFPHDALHTLAERSEVVAVQGFGRFGPLGPSLSDSRVRFDLSQDFGVLLWAPLALIGLIESIGLGQSQWRVAAPPTGFALLVWAALAWLVVTAYLPMAWDRYLLPIQAVNALLTALGPTMVWERLVRIASTLRARA